MKTLIRSQLFLIFCFLCFHTAPVHAADTTRTEVGPGMTYMHINDPSQPNHIVVLEIDLTYSGNTITTVLANDRLHLGSELVSSMSRRNTGDGHLVIGALNGDYFSSGPYDKLRDGQIKNNEYIFGGYRNRSSFGMTSDGKPVVDILNFTGEITLDDESSYHIQGMNAPQPDNGLVLYNYYTGPNTRSDDISTEWRLTPQADIATNQPVPFEVATVRRHQGSMTIAQDDYVLTGTGSIADDLYNALSEGDQVQVTMGVQPSLHEELADKGIAELMGGGPRLLTDGDFATDDFIGFEGFGEHHSGERHPRTAIGFNEDSTIVYFVVIDGRQHTSRGMTMKETAETMKGIGAWNAVNLDGGGSSTLVVRDEEKNDHDRSFGLGSYRPVANGLLAVSEISYEEISQKLEISPQEVVMDTSETRSFSTELTDLWGYILPDSESGVTWELVDLQGDIDSEGNFTATDFGEGYVVAHHGELSDSASVIVPHTPGSAVPDNSEVPLDFVLKQNYPNPFNPDTRITYAVPQTTHVKVTVYDLLGRPVAILTDQSHQAGTHTVQFDASRISSGTYIYEMIAGEFVDRKKMTLVK